MFNPQRHDRTPLNGPQMIAQLRRIGLLEAAADESNEIVLRTADRITQLARTATGELTSLQQQVEATIDAIDAPHGETQASGAAGSASRPRPVSPEAREALQDARRAVDLLLQGLDGATLQPRRGLKVQIRTLVPAAAAILLLAAGLGVATGWLSGAPSAVPHNQAPTAMVATTGNTPSVVGRPSSTSPDDLRAAAEVWLRAYFETGSPPASTSRPAVRDERLPGERLAADAERRVIAPARIDIFGDAAVLSTSVTETPKPPADRALVSLVAQLWTRTPAGWHLDDVRIVSATGAEDAFRR
jgi:hypothetical protein